MENYEPANEVKRALIQRQIQAHANSRYEVEILAKVNKAIGADPAAIAQYISDLVRLEKIIDALQEELGTIPPTPA